MSSEYTTSIDMLTDSSISSSAGVTASTIGPMVDVSQREAVNIQFVGNITSGDGNFAIDGSNDGKNWVQGIAYLDAGQTTSTTLQTSSVLSSASGYTRGAYIQFRWQYLRCRVDVSGTGTYYAFLTAN